MTDEEIISSIIREVERTRNLHYLTHDDLHQEAQLALLDARRKFDRARSGWKSWLNLILRYHFRDILRRLDMYTIPDPPSADFSPDMIPSPSPHSSPSTCHLLHDAWTRVYQLSPLRRYIVIRHLYEDQPYSTLSAELDMSKQLIQYHYAHALYTLRELPAKRRGRPSRQVT
jgi:RNA polymerase sigma factor (sigma-70 family)